MILQHLTGHGQSLEAAVLALPHGVYQFIRGGYLAVTTFFVLSGFVLAHGYAREGMPAYVALQEEEFASQPLGYTAVRHQREVGTGYFDQVLMTISGGTASTGALKGSTEEEQFKAVDKQLPALAGSAN